MKPRYADKVESLKNALRPALQDEAGIIIVEALSGLILEEAERCENKWSGGHKFTTSSAITMLRGKL